MFELFVLNSCGCVVQMNKSVSLTLFSLISFSSGQKIRSINSYSSQRYIQWSKRNTKSKAKTHCLCLEMKSEDWAPLVTSLTLSANQISPRRSCSTDRSINIIMWLHIYYLCHITFTSDCMKNTHTHDSKWLSSVFLEVSQTVFLSCDTQEIESLCLHIMIDSLRHDEMFKHINDHIDMTEVNELMIITSVNSLSLNLRSCVNVCVVSQAGRCWRGFSSSRIPVNPRRLRSSAPGFWPWVYCFRSVIVSESRTAAADTSHQSLTWVSSLKPSESDEGVMSNILILQHI